MPDETKDDVTAAAGQAAMDFLCAFLAGDEDAEERAADEFRAARAAMEAAGCPMDDEPAAPAEKGA